jgi:hypothetical protein
MVRTGAYAYINYGYENTFGGTASAITNSFGQRTAISGLTLTTNKIALGKLGQVDPTAFAYGTQNGTLGINFVLGDITSHKIFKSILGSASGAGTSGNPYIYGSATEGAATKSLIGNTFTTEIGFQGETDTMVRTLKGCVANSLSMSTSIGGTVDCSVDAVYGKEDAPSTSGFSDDATENSQPFTFAHGSLKIGGSIIAELQEADINFSQNGDLLYSIGDQQSVAGIKRSLDISGRFRASWKNDNLIDQLILQLKGSTYKETVESMGTPELELVFTNGASSAKSITITGYGLGINDHAVSGLEPVEPVFEEINWQVKRAKITVVDQ